ncbi:MAG: sugar nucleotide-binding protein [Bacteroidales bacterium]|nr:sugar nucleotide-binding protein [Bacteroidales bacterium]
MQTILGSGGSIGTELAKALKTYTSDIRLVARNPKKVNETDQLFKADLTHPNEVDRAIEGSEITYVTIGFAYDKKLWKQVWVPLIKAVIEACKKHKSKLVFFDNIYMYDRDHLSNMTEETPIRPTSVKGEIRAEVAQLIMKEVANKDLTALIARAADFLGTKNSVAVETIYKNLKKGKPADLIASADKIHNFTWVPDAGKATAILGNTPDAYNQVWHLPSISEKLTMKQWVELFATELGVKPKSRVLPIWMMGILGIFVPIMKELKEMAYQNDRDYYFNSSKFEKRFGYKPIGAKEAVKEIVHQLEKQ